MNKFLTAATVLSTVVCSAAVGFGAEKLVLAGSTTVLPIAQLAVEKYMEAHPGVELSLSASGSGDGLKALIDGTADIANSSRFIKQSEVEAAVKNKTYPVPFAIALDALIPVINPANPVTSLTIDQLKGIYSGAITNWKEVGGNSGAIAVVGRDTSSGTYEVWNELVMRTTRVTPRALVTASNGAVVQTVAKNPQSIGYIGVGYQSKDIKSVQVNGISGSEATVRNGTYPIARSLFMFTRGWPVKQVAGFINFMLSNDGQNLVKKSGFIPLR